MDIWQIWCCGKDCDWKDRQHVVDVPFLNMQAAFNRCNELNQRLSETDKDEHYYSDQFYKVLPVKMNIKEK